jgi:probable HAF family extracellular repeat protein
MQNPAGRGDAAVRRTRAVVLASTALTMLAVAPARAADAFQPLGTIPGTVFNLVTGISGDGSLVVGRTDTVGWTWSNGVYTFLTGFGGVAIPTATSFNGSVVVGIADIGGFNYHAVRWTAGGTVLTDLHSGPAFNPGGTLAGYGQSRAFGVSADGTVVAGYATNGSSTDQAFVWTQATGMFGLGTLAGYARSSANAVSGNGQVVIGYAYGSTHQAFRWTQATGMVGLGFLPGGTASTAGGVNYDGSVIVGSGNSLTHPDAEAFRWTAATGMVGLGGLPGSTQTSASAVSADGSIVVGYSYASATGSNAFRWTQATGMQSLASMLTRGGVNLGGWQLSIARAISADGRIIVGNGTNPAGDSDVWLARCASLECTTLLSSQAVANSFAGQSAVGQTANAAIGGSLGTMQEYATQARQSQGSRNTPYSVFGYGAYDSDPVASGTLGITADLPFGLVTGFTVATNHVRTDMVYGGNAKMFGGAIGAFVARAPETGLQWLLGASAITLEGDIARGYLNGVTPVTSTGSTSGNGYGGIARLGRGFAVMPQATVTPFVSYTFAQTRFGGYNETGGAFAASFADFLSTSQTLRVGGDARYTFATNAWVWGTLAWGHRPDGGKGANISGTLIDAPFSYTAPGLSSAKDWAEVGGGIRLPAWNNGAATASVTASITPNQTTTYVSRLGVVQAF